MSLMVFVLVVCLITLLMVSCLFYALFMQRNPSDPYPTLVKPDPKFLKPWVKGKKMTPKFNDDNAALEKERNQ